LPAYRVADLVVTKKGGLADVSASIMNISDEKYFESSGFSQADWQERGYPMPGRRFEIRVSY
jgi:outer membrane receptor protein involved in Fe transport